MVSWHDVGVDVNIETYHVRIGNFVVKCIEEHTIGVFKEMVIGNQILFLGLVIMVVLVIERVVV
jgi:hypothetical protein